ncbi:hypothetical protein Dimus_018192 [Dionaea muscipula]
MFDFCSYSVRIFCTSSSTVPTWNCFYNLIFCSIVSPLFTKLFLHYLLNCFSIVDCHVCNCLFIVCSIVSLLFTEFCHVCNCFYNLISSLFQSVYVFTEFLDFASTEQLSEQLLMSNF